VHSFVCDLEKSFIFEKTAEITLYKPHALYALRYRRQYNFARLTLWKLGVQTAKMPFKGTATQVHCKYDNISETVRDGVVVSTSTQATNRK